MTTRSKIYSDWHKHYMEQMGLDFSVEPLTMEETNEEWRKAYVQATAPEEYNWSGAYLDSLDDLYGIGDIDYRYTVEEFNELLRKTMYNVVTMERSDKYSHPMTA